MEIEARASYVTRKQINVIFSNAKRGNLKVEKGFMAHLYNMTEANVWKSENSRTEDFNTVRVILDAIFGSDMEKAQELIEKAEAKNFDELGNKAKASYDRAFVA